MSFFTNLNDSMRQPSTIRSRKSTQRNAIAELIAVSLSELNPSILIPTKIWQLADSTLTALSSDTIMREKIAHAVVATISGIEAMLSAYLFAADNEDCQDTTVQLCRLLFTIHLVCRGLIVAGWATDVMTEEEDRPMTPGKTD